jgi:hypothetical protein
LKQTQQCGKVIDVEFETFEIHFKGAFVIGSLLGDHGEAGVCPGGADVQSAGDAERYFGIIKKIVLEGNNSEADIGACLIGLEQCGLFVALLCAVVVADMHVAIAEFL